MNILLVGVNASFSHTCLAVRQLSAFTGIPFIEFTINQPVGEILRGIADLSPRLVLFSTYIWNSEIVSKIIPDVKKILPEALIGAGGPEYGYAASLYLKKLSDLDFIIQGEGEVTLEEIGRVLEESKGNKDDFLRRVSEVKGIFIRKGDLSPEKTTVEKGDPSPKAPVLHFTGEQPLLCDLSVLPFAYPDLKTAADGDRLIPPELQNKIFYYESSRGCPFKCSYCLSSLDTRVRYMPLDRVYKDIQIFLDVEAPLVKFVDRTYNLMPERYISIWKYIKDHHNGKTMFHFEIEAEFLTQEALEFLQTVPEGVMQFEIGVQSANKQTLKAINRSDNIEKLAANIRRIPRTIHQHLDLIAGLPYEGIESFGKSFDFVMELRPDALQLGFLKILHGTQMEKMALENGWKWMENPVYETFSTPYLSYKDMLFLKDLEIILDAYWNSGVFKNLMEYFGRKTSFWEIIRQITENAQEDKIFSAARRETFWFEYMAKLINNRFFDKWHELDSQVLMNLLRYDFVKRGKQGNFPQWYIHRYDKERHRILLEESEGIENSRIGFAFSEYEVFDYDVSRPVPEEEKGVFEILLKYPRRVK